MTIEEMHAVAKDTTVPQKFLEHAANRADKVLFRSMTSAPGSGDTTWQNYTYADVRSLTARTAAGLQALDVEPGERAC